MNSMDIVDSAEELKLGEESDSICDYVGIDTEIPVYGVDDDVEVEYSVVDETIANVVYSDKTQVAVACLKDNVIKHIRSII